MIDTCGCCAGVGSAVPPTAPNRPGLPALSYRVATHSTFLAAMRGALSAAFRGFPPENRLHTRTTDDFSVALLDAWAVVADVLTFYQERIVNEGYLGTAVERRSVLELSRLIGYELRPGVASSVYLAYTLEKDSKTRLAVGNRAQSVPAGPGDLPQSFETADPLDARTEWNALAPRLSRPQAIPPVMKAGRRVFLDGVATRLRPNDMLLFGAAAGDLYRADAVKPVPAAGHTVVTVEPWSGASAQAGAAKSAAAAVDTAQKAIALLPAFGNLTVDITDALSRLALQLVNPDPGTLNDTIDGAIDSLDYLVSLVNDQAGKINAGWGQALQDLQQTLTDQTGAVAKPQGQRIRALQDIIDRFQAQLALPPSAAPPPPDTLTPAIDATLKQLHENGVAAIVPFSDREDAVQAAIDALRAAASGTGPTNRRTLLAALKTSLTDYLVDPRADAVTALSNDSTLAAVQAALVGLANSLKTRALPVGSVEPPANYEPKEAAGVIQDAIEALRVATLSADDRDRAVSALTNVVRGLPAGSLRGALRAIGAHYNDPASKPAKPKETDLSPIEVRLLYDPVGELFDEFANLGPGLTIDEVTARINDALGAIAVGEQNLRQGLTSGSSPNPDLIEWADAVSGSLRALGTSLQARPVERVATQAILQILARYQDVGQGAGIDLDTEIAERVTGDLLELIEAMDQAPKVPADTAPSQVVLDTFRQTITSLRAELKIAEAGGYPRVGPWLSGLVNDLDDAERVLRARFPAVTGPGTSRTRAHATGGAATGQPSDSNILLGGLAKPPSIPPESSARLERSLGAAFSPASAQSSTPLASSDVIPQLLVSLSPALSATLYPALSNFAATPSPEPGAVYAMRARAALFGHNAPRQPVLGEGSQSGTVVATAEWPLAPLTVSIEIVLTARVFSATAVASATLTVTSQGKTAAPVPFTVADNTPVHTDAVDATVSVDFPNKRVTLSFQNKQNSADVIKQIVLELGDLPDVQLSIPPLVSRKPVTAADGVVAGRAGDDEYQVSIFAPDTLTLIAINVTDTFPGPLPPEARTVLALDATYDQVTPGSWVVIDRDPSSPGASPPVVAQVQGVATVSKADFGMSAKVTQLTIATPWLGDADRSLSALRNVAVYAQSELLALADEPYDADVSGDQVELDRLYDGLKSGRWLIVSGERTDIPATSGVTASELVMIKAVKQDARPDLPGDRLHSTLVLSNPLAYAYKRATVTLYGNVVRATHGETRAEVLGSGQGSQELQTFTLQQSPLTYVSAATAQGAESTLQVRVNGVLWHEEDSLAGLGPKDRKYVTRTDDRHKTTVVFGNGAHGARLPTGPENVKAVYRFGIGLPGNVGAGRISLLATRPLGVKGVINPLPASGGADAEDRDQARRNAPTAVTALDRIVSVQDYEDFARTFAGIAKASAARLPGGRAEVVHLTVAGAADDPVVPTSDLYRNLLRALRTSGDPFQPIQVDPRELIPLVLSAEVRVADDYLWEPVAAEVRARLLDAFGFDRRALGQSAYLSEVFAVIQTVAGVEYVRVSHFGGVPEQVAMSAGQGKPRRVVSTPPEVIRALIEGDDGGVLANVCPDPGGVLANVCPDPDGAPTLGIANSPPAHAVAAALARFDPSTRTIRPAQLAVLRPDVPDTLILNEIAP